MRISSVMFGLIVSSSAIYHSGVSAQSIGYLGCFAHTNQLLNQYDPYNAAHYDINGWSGYQTSVSVPLSANPGDVLLTLTKQVLPDLLGLQDNQKAAAAYIPLVDCQAGAQEIFRPAGQQSPTDSTVYTFPGAPNIGVRVYYPNLGTGTAGEIVNTAGATGSRPSANGIGLYMLYFPVGQAKIEYILLSQNWTNGAPSTGAQTITNGIVAQSTVGGWGAGRLLRYTVPAITFTPEPCHFAANTVTDYTLQPVESSSFTALHQKLSPLKFDLRMQCNSSRPSPKVTFNGTPHSSNTPGLINNDLPPASNPAQGVAILLEHVPSSGSKVPVNLSGGTPITNLGTPSNCGTNCSEWTLGLEASYYNTSTTITPGNVRGRVSVTVEHM